MLWVPGVFLEIQMPVDESAVCSVDGSAAFSVTSVMAITSLVFSSVARVSPAAAFKAMQSFSRGGRLKLTLPPAARPFDVPLPV